MSQEIYRAKRTRTLEVICDNAAQPTFNFKSDSVLQDAAMITAIEAYTADDLSYSPEGKDMQPTNIFKMSSLVIAMKNGNEQQIEKSPLQALNPTLNGNRLFLCTLKGINLTSCYIKVAKSNQATAGAVWVFTFHYLTKADIQKQHA